MRKDYVTKIGGRFLYTRMAGIGDRRGGEVRKDNNDEDPDWAETFESSELDIVL